MKATVMHGAGDVRVEEVEDVLGLIAIGASGSGGLIIPEFEPVGHYREGERKQQHRPAEEQASGASHLAVLTGEGEVGIRGDEVFDERVGLCQPGFPAHRSRRLSRSAHRVSPRLQRPI